MTYKELLDAIKASPKTIRVAEEAHPGHTFLTITFWENEKENIVRQSAFNVIITDAGLATEAAYFDNTKPAYMYSTTFKAQVEATAASFQAANQRVESYKVVEVDEAAKTAKIQAYVYDATAAKSTLKTYFVFDKAGALTIREMA